MSGSVTISTKGIPERLKLTIPLSGLYWPGSSSI